MLENLTDDRIRSRCRDTLESLEHWLRRLIDEVLGKAYGDYFSHMDAAGNRLIKKAIVDSLEDRVSREPTRYLRKIDAVLLSDAIDIICNPRLYPHFAQALQQAFPDGCHEARTFLVRLLDPRNRLAHAHPISLRQGEQVICYSNDTIDSLKAYYGRVGMDQEFNVPLILRVNDSFGNSFHRDQMSPFLKGGVSKDLQQPQYYLWPGDLLTVEVEVDPTFDPSTYTVTWASAKGLEGPPPVGRRAVVKILERHIGLSFDIQCSIATKNDWHRMLKGIDDYLILTYRVLPIK